jgi:hypothetical protein
MPLSRERLEAESALTGFRPDILEKVSYLLALLEGFSRHPFLKGKLALKGGTALNLFVFDVPRLSIDIDLNYIGAVDRETMLLERPRIEDAIAAVCQREGLTVKKTPSEHAGGSWNLRYTSAFGRSDTIKIDVIYMYRVPLWSPVIQDSKPVGTLVAKQVLVLDEYELVAGKLSALFARQTSRDLFDAHALLTKRNLEPERLRLAFVIYGAMNRKDWRTVRIEDIDRAATEFESYLVPLLRKGTFDVGQDSSLWASTLTSECKAAMEQILPLRENELMFLQRILDAGEIEPQHLTEDSELAERVCRHPDLLWKAMHVKKHYGIP